MAKAKPPLPKGLPAEDLRQVCDPDSLGFSTTDELPAFEGHLGQERAIDALSLSARMKHRDFNVYVLGREGYGRHHAVHRILETECKDASPPPDWVYVNNFEAPHCPRALCMPPGTAVPFRRAMQSLIDDLGNEIPALFDSDEYQTQRSLLEQEFGGRHEAELAEFGEKARREEIGLVRTPMGFVLVAIEDGEIVKPDAFEALDAKKREAIEAKIARLQEDLADVLRNAPKLEKEHRRELEKLHSDMAKRAVSERLTEVAGQLPKDPGIEAYLEDVRRDIIDNAELFLTASARDGNNGPFPPTILKYHQLPEFRRYQVNVMISQDPSEGSGAPIVYEDLPNMGHLVGRIEHISQMGALMTDFTLVKPGALHRANGGFLVLDARRVLSEPFAWDALKRCLINRTISIQSMSDRISLVSTVSLEPDPIPLNVRVVLIGDRWLHAVLSEFDPEFRELFKIQADFEEDFARDPDNSGNLARLLATITRARGLRPMNAPAVARLLDEAARHAKNADKLSLELRALSDLVSEADHYAAQDGRATVLLEDLNRAIAQTELRASRVRERMQDAILRETILIETRGAVVGQVNGLSVYTLGGVSFGRPSRITARVRMGAGKLVDIEREVDLGGPLHSKGVLILSSYLSSTFALDVPMSLQASIVFEQSYGGVDGDSASSAELYALLSALSGVPLRQGLAVTGSVNQRGEVQAIGGVNEKIEGFFDICRARGLTGDQGVLIPKANTRHLMLRPDLVEAAQAGNFRVIAVSTIDEGIEVLTGQAAGARGRGGAYPKGSVNGRVETALRDFARTRAKYMLRSRDEGTRDG